MTKTDIAASIAQIWKEVLDEPVVGANDNFRSLGGTSLNAVTILALIGAEFSVEITASEFLREPTISGLANLVHARSAVELF